MEKTMKTVPTAALRFAAQSSGGQPLRVEFDTTDGEAPDKFVMHGYTGARMSTGFFGDIIINTAGVDLGEQGKVFSILREHDPLKIAGQGTVTTDGVGIFVDGKFSKVTHDGKELAGLAGEGQPMQASISIDDSDIVEVPEGESLSVNGRNEKGPFTLFAKSRLREVSFTSLGMDAGTDSIAASEGNTREVRVLEYEKEATVADEEKKVDVPEEETPKVDEEEAKADAPDAHEAEEETPAEDETPTDPKAEFMAEFDSMLAAFPEDQEFALAAFRAGDSLEMAKAKHYDVLVERLKASAAQAPAAPAGSPPAPIGTNDEADMPANFSAAADQLRKERNERGESLTKAQAELAAAKAFPKLYEQHVANSQPKLAH